MEFELYQNGYVWPWSITYGGLVPNSDCCVGEFILHANGLWGFSISMDREEHSGELFYRQGHIQEGGLEDQKYAAQQAVCEILVDLADCVSGQTWEVPAQWKA